MEFEDVEKARNIYKSKLQKHIYIDIAITLGFSLFMTLITGSSLSTFLFIAAVFGFMVAIFSFIITLIVLRKEADAYRSAYKAYFVEKNLQKTFTDLNYSHEAGLHRTILGGTGMVNVGDRYNSNDLTTGKYKDVAFTQADVHIEVEYTDSDGDTHYTTIFKGRFMIFEFPKKFNFRLEVAEKGFGANKIPSKNHETGRNFKKIELESSEFNHIFKTYAEDDFEAFYLLDPAFMDNTLDLANQYKGKILLGFLDNKLLVGLKDGKDAFEPPSVFKKIDEATETAKIASDINLITNFVDTLKLNNKLFK